MSEEDRCSSLQEQEGLHPESYTVTLRNPQRSPWFLTLCFQCEWNILDHVTVLAMVKARLRGTPGQIIRLQYVPRSVIHGKPTLKDLWLVTVDSQDAKKELLRGLYFQGHNLTIKKYDEVLEEQRLQQQRIQEVSKMIQTMGVKEGGKESGAISILLAQEGHG